MGLAQVKAVAMPAVEELAVAEVEAVAMQEVKKLAAAEAEAVIELEVGFEQVATTVAAEAVVDLAQVSKEAAATEQVSPHLLILVED